MLWRLATYRILIKQLKHEGAERLTTYRNVFQCGKVVGVTYDGRIIFRRVAFSHGEPPSKSTELVCRRLHGRDAGYPFYFGRCPLGERHERLNRQLIVAQSWSLKAHLYLNVRA